VVCRATAQALYRQAIPPALWHLFTKVNASSLSRSLFFDGQMQEQHHWCGCTACTSTARRLFQTLLSTGELKRPSQGCTSRTSPFTATIGAFMLTVQHTWQVRSLHACPLCWWSLHLAKLLMSLEQRYHSTPSSGVWETLHGALRAACVGHR
jgi:hypothetical protein